MTVEAERTPEFSPTIFLNYRRDDSSPYAGRLYDRLVSQFGKESVFLDIETIELGSDAVETIGRTIGSCSVLLVVIGPKWLRLEAPSGGRRIDDPKDFVRLEICAALDRDVRVVPLLVAGAAMPTESELPEPLRALARRQGLEIHDGTFHLDVTHLIDSLEHSGRPAVLVSSSKARRVTSSQTLAVCGIDEVTSWHWSGAQLADQLIQLDRATIDGLTLPHAGTVSQWAPILMEHPDTWRLLIDRPESIVGNWHFLSLFDEDYEDALRGALLDETITADRVRPLGIPGWHKLYLIAFFLLPQFRQVHNFRLLLGSLFDHLTTLAQLGVFVEEIVANAYSPSAVALCRSLGFSFVGPHSDHGKIYRRALVPLPELRLLDAHKELAKLYQEAQR